LIEVVAISSVDVPEFEALFVQDSRLAAISRGFLLASRVLAHFDVHPCSFPALPPTHTSELWGFWDLVLDVICAQDPSDANPFEDIFPMISLTFQNFHSPACFRLLAYFLTVPGYRDESLELLCSESASLPLAHGLSHRLTEALIVARDPRAYLIIARLMLDSPPHDDDVRSLVNELSTNNPNPRIVRALLLAICCAMCHDHRIDRGLSDACLRYADTGSPYSALLFGQLRAKGATFSDTAALREAFEKMANDTNANRRAAAVFALGQTWDLRAIPAIAERLSDAADIVAEQAVLAMAVALRFDPKRFRLDDTVIEAIRKGLNVAGGRVGVRAAYESARPAFEEFFARVEGRDVKEERRTSRAESEINLIERLKKSVREPGIVERYELCVFEAV
jgi:hypothetical protein